MNVSAEIPRLTPVTTEILMISPDIKRECELAVKMYRVGLTTEERDELLSLWDKNKKARDTQTVADRAEDERTESRAFSPDRTNPHD